MSAAAPGVLWLGREGGAPDVSREVAGAKAARIWRMGRLGLAVPPAFVLPTALCAEVNRDPAQAEARVRGALETGLDRLEAATALSFGDPRAPLLVSVRSGAAVSMPGMLATVLNVGLNDETLHGLIRRTGDPRLAWDSYRRFVEGYATVVGGAPAAPFARRLKEMVAAEGVGDEAELDGEALERLALDYREIARRLMGAPIPHGPLDQLAAAALAVFRSWEGERARAYRRLHGLEGLAGTAVAVQAMAFGNAGRRSGAGVAFSRDPATGEKALYVDFLLDAQGEDVVSGRRTPGDAELLRARLPEAAAELDRGAALLEAEFRDVQDIEFTVEDGALWFLQSRTAERTPRAALRVAVDLVREGVLDPATALDRVGGIDPQAAAVSRFVTPAEPVARAVPAAPGVASGRAAFDVAGARALVAAGDPVVLVRREPSTDDVEGFAVAQGVLTAVGGRTAHAAVVLRQMARVCLVGCRELVVDGPAGAAVLAGRDLRAGDWISLDGDRGEVSLGRREIVSTPPEAELAEIARWRETARAG